MTALSRASDATDFLVDRENGTLINTNNAALAAYKMQREEIRKLHTVTSSVENLNARIDRIESLLTQLLSK